MYVFHRFTHLHIHIQVKFYLYTSAAAAIKATTTTTKIRDIRTKTATGEKKKLYEKCTNRTEKKRNMQDGIFKLQQLEGWRKKYHITVLCGDYLSTYIHQTLQSGTFQYQPHSSIRNLRSVCIDGRECLFFLFFFFWFLFLFFSHGTSVIGLLSNAGQNSKLVIMFSSTF